MGEIKAKALAMEKAVEERRRQMTDYHSYSEDDQFSMDGKPAFAVVDFWRYEFGALVNLQDTIAEYLVSRALGVEKAENVLKWTGYDVSYRRKRIEIKATRYIHSWNKEKQSSVRTFSIAPSHNDYWLVKNDDGKKLSRQNDLYVFCLKACRDYDRFDPLRIDDWEFYVIPTYRINERCERIGIPNQKKISLNVVREMAGKAVKWPELKTRVDDVIKQIDQWIEENDRLPVCREGEDSVAGIYICR